MTHPEAPGQFQGTVKRPKSGCLPNCLNDLPTHMKSRSLQKLTTPHSMATAHSSVMAHTLWCVLRSESKQTQLLPIAVSLTEFLQWDIKAWASLGPEARHHRFWWGSNPRREELKDGRKKQWERHAEESPSQPARKSAKYLTCAHSFHWPDPWHKH